MRALYLNLNPNMPGAERAKGIESTTVKTAYVFPTNIHRWQTLSLCE
jgi:hypothetical protein